MIIGQDFEKMRFSAFGLDLLEPNAIIGDLLIFFLSLFFAFKIYPLITTKKFYKYWFYFFLVFGLGFLCGGLGHTFFNYWGIPGKYAGWYLSVFSVFFAEQAMLDAWQNLKLKTLFQKISVVKLFVVLIAMFLFYNFINFNDDEQRGLLIPASNSFIGLFSTLGVLSWQFQTKVHDAFKFFWIGVLITIPSGIFQMLKINIHPWLDRNDVAHILLIISIFFYFKAISQIKFEPKKVLF